MIESIITAFVPHIMVIVLMLGFLVLGILAKIGSGVYLNVFSLNAKFDWKIFLVGVAKGVIFALSIFAVALVLSGLPIVMGEAGILFVEGAETFSATMPLLAIIPAIYKNVKDAYENYKKTLNVTDEDIVGLVKEDTLG